MNSFGTYSQYYDLLYREKDYAGEVHFVSGLIEKFAPHAHSILDLGCGTGTHAELFAGQGRCVFGVDRSQKMLDDANARLMRIAPDIAQRMKFQRGDVRSVKLNRRFDVVVALFHVMSYQATNGDLQASFSTALEHLKPGGLFIFDFWYGPGVLDDQPAPRLKKFEDDNIKVFRFANPSINSTINIVDVNYDLIILDKKTENYQEFSENHRMRYLFKPELDFMLKTLGFSIVHFGTWMSDQIPDLNTWNAVVVAQVTPLNEGDSP